MKEETIHLTSRFSWKFIPVLFSITLAYEIGVFIYVSKTFPELSKVGFPTSLEKAQELAELLTNHLSTHYGTLLFFQISSFLFLQTWCIPGTIFFNLLGGALFGMYVGFPVCLACNTLGALHCYLISKYFAGEVVERKFASQILIVKKKLEEHRKDLFFYMVSSRIFPGSPNWFMNITFPHLKIPLHYYIPSIAIGLTPWNFLTCRAGIVIKNLKSRSDIVQTADYLILVVIACCFLLPPIVKRILKKKEKVN